MENLLPVTANRLGYNEMNVGQLTAMQEAANFTVFALL
ncbi:DMT family protein [Shewanella sp. SG41-3]